MAKICGVLLSTVAAGALMSGVAVAADLKRASVPQPGPVAALPAAVDGINGSLSVYGGTGNDSGVFGANGSIALPIGLSYGTQIDASIASVDGKFYGSIADHLFWRDPNKGLVGLYGSYSYYDRFGGADVGHVAAEGEYYAGRFTVRGLAGVEFGSKGSDTYAVGYRLWENSFDVKTRFFDMVDVVYYPTDNLSLFAGHRYSFGKNALALGGEYLVQSFGTGSAVGIFAEGRIGENDDKAVYAGVKFHFGNSNKTLIRRDREDDPKVWEPDSMLGLGGVAQNRYVGEITPP